MRRISIFLLISLLFVISNTVAGQYREKILSFPNAAELGSFGRTPVGLFTGTNQISIPIAELKTKNLTYPISLNYSSNGLIVNKISSRVGFDWTMPIEGVIIRVINGQPDDIENFRSYPVNLDPAYFDSRTQQERQAEYTYYNSWDAYDNTEPDMYSFNFCGYSGQFYTDFKNNSKIVMVPYQNMTVENLSNHGFHIIDDKGIQYFFEDGEKLQFGPGYSGLTTSTYYLSKVLHPAGDSIVLNYVIKSGTKSYISSVTDDISCAVLGGTACSQTGPQSFNPGLNYAVGNLNMLTDYYKLVQYVDAPGYGRINFTYDEINRLDLRDEPRLVSLSVLNMNGELIKTVSLYHQFPNATLFNNVGDYTPAPAGTDNVNYRMFLDSVVFKDSQGGRVQKYLFEYNNLNQLPVRLSYAQDHWGYFNGASNSTLMPDSIPSSIKQAYFANKQSRMLANRNANYLYSQKGLLSKVTFPTGGYTTYEYEAHRSTIHSSVEHGGVRLKKQQNYSSTGQLAYTNEYSYSGGTAGWDINNIKYYVGRTVAKYCLCHDIEPPYEAEVRFSTYKLYSSPIYSLSLSDGNYIGYQYVTIYNGDATTNVGKEVDEFEIGNDNFEQLLLYYNSISGPLMFPRPYDNSGWKSGTKLRETYYQNNSGTYVPVKENIYTYAEDASNAVINYFVSIQNDDFDWPTYVISNPDQINRHFDVNRYSIISKWRYLSKKVETTYDHAGAVMVKDTTNYCYDNSNHAQLTREYTSDSKGNKIKRLIRYPKDYTTSSFNLGTLKTNHVENLPIDTRKYVNGKLVDGEQIKFNGYGQPTDIYNVEAFKTDTVFDSMNPYKFVHKTSYKYNIYKNIKQIDHEYNISTSFLWSFNNTLPVAKIENATYAQDSTSLGSSFINTLGTTTSNSSVTTQLTSLRNTLKSALPSAWVSTYNYTPQVGMIFQTDPNGVSTYYEYDFAGRLKNVRDKDQYILNRYYYHYYLDPKKDTVSLNVSVSSISLPYTASGSSFAVTSNCSWTVSSNAGWLTVNPTAGIISGSVNINATVNPGAIRTATVTVTYGTGQTKTVTVSQAKNGSTLSTNTSNITMGPQSVWYYVTVTSNTSWNATTDRPSWITLSPTSGTGNGTLGIKPTALSSGSRIGSVTLTTTDGAVSVTISITQNSY